jgi:hypothetical protein
MAPSAPISDTFCGWSEALAGGVVTAGPERDPDSAGMAAAGNKHRTAVV